MNKKYIFDSFLKLLSQLSSKKILYISNKHIKPTNLAAKSSYGFWYCGNIFDQTDIAYGIANNGTVEQYDTDFVYKLLKSLPDDFVFFDVGANTGWYTILASTVSNSSIVHSFEPVMEHLTCLRETILLNRIEKRVTVHDIALSDNNGESVILLAGSGSSLEQKFLTTHNGKRIIKTKTLDTIVQEGKIPMPTFIKIDVEGHEYKVLQGAHTILAQTKPILFIEIAQTLKNIHRDFIHPDFENIFALLKTFGYIAYVLSNNTIKPYNITNNLDGVYMFLFVHTENHSDIIQSLPK